MNDHKIVLTIQDLLDGVEWSTDTLSQIADLLNGNGYKIRDIGDCEFIDGEMVTSLDLSNKGVS